MKITLSNETLNSIDLSRYKARNLDIGNKYFYLESGKEHYRLLTYLSTLFSSQTFFDIGTNHGCSALALGHNPSNKVISFDIVNNRKESFDQEFNITFSYGSCKDFFLNCRPSIIFLDADKSNDFEMDFIKFLIENNFGGLLIMDDLYEYPIVADCINYLRDLGYKVYDVSKYGHYSGTHIVDFGGNLTLEFN